MINAVFSAASRATVGSTFVYRSLVVLIEACRSIACTTFMSTPAANDSVAAP